VKTQRVDANIMNQFHIFYFKILSSCILLSLFPISVKGKLSKLVVHYLVMIMKNFSKISNILFFYYPYLNSLWCQLLCYSNWIKITCVCDI